MLWTYFLHFLRQWIRAASDGKSQLSMWMHIYRFRLFSINFIWKLVSIHIKLFHSNYKSIYTYDRVSCESVLTASGWRRKTKSYAQTILRPVKKSILHCHWSFTSAIKLMRTKCVAMNHFRIGAFPLHRESIELTIHSADNATIMEQNRFRNV